MFIIITITNSFHILNYNVLYFEKQVSKKIFPEFSKRYRHQLKKALTGAAQASVETTKNILKK